MKYRHKSEVNGGVVVNVGAGPPTGAPVDTDTHTLAQHNDDTVAALAGTEPSTRAVKAAGE